MTDQKKDDDNMLALPELEKNINVSKQKRKDVRDILMKQLKNKGMRKGRVRPRNPIKAKILNEFKRKD